MEDKPLEFQSEPKEIKDQIVNPLRIIGDQLQTDVAPLEAEQPNFDILDLSKVPQKSVKIKKQSKLSAYKTKMCTDGRECRKQFTCRFAHTETELRKPFMNRKTQCKQYQKGLCHLGSACREYHGNLDLKKKYPYKTKACLKFLQGECQLGELCIHLHEEALGQIEEMKQQRNLQQQLEPVQAEEAIKPNIKKVFSTEVSNPSKEHNVQISQQQIRKQPQLIMDGLSFDI